MNNLKRLFYLHMFTRYFSYVDQDKENELRNHQATQAVIQRRKRPKRRSTGVVHVDFDEIDPDRQDTSSCGGTDESIEEVSCCVMYLSYEYHYNHCIINKVFFTCRCHNINNLSVYRTNLMK